MIHLRISALGILLLATILSGCKSSGPAAPTPDGLTSETTIHQEIVFRAPASRIYEALTNGDKFGAITGRGVPEFGREVGGAFAIFDGVIYGRHLEMVPNQRLVQAWRERVWPPGVFSVVRFELKEEAGKPGQTRLIFDHTGFPVGAGPHLCVGWHEHYWDPLHKALEK